jgi:branched-chain amino acid transport system permease protein
MLRRPSLPAAIFLALLLVLFLGLPFFGGPYAIKFATRMIVLATFVLSLDLLIGITGLVSFGHAAFFGVGAYAVYFVSPESEAANAFVALTAGIGLAAAAALLIGAFAVLTRGFYFIMVSLAAGQMIFSLFHDTDIAKGSDGAYINVKPTLAIGAQTWFDFSDRVSLYYVAVAILVVIYGLLFALVRSPFGRVLQAIRVNEMRTGALGYNTYLFKLAAFAIAGAVAGLAGALFASIDGFVTPELMSWHQSGLAIMMVVLGGAGTLFGPILGALAYISFEDLLKTASLVGSFVAGHWRLGTGLTLIIAVLLSPEGLAGFFAWIAPKDAPARPPAAAAVVENLERAGRQSGKDLSGKVLSTVGLTRRFGGLVAVDDVSLHFAANRVHAIIGPNGAGKTTFGNLLSGALAPTAGTITIDDRDVSGWAAFRIARRGLGRSFQRTNIFPRFTVAENCALAAQARTPVLTRLVDAPYRALEQACVAHALAVAGLADRAQAIAGQLSNGEQRQLEIAMLVASGAGLMILDEPLAGMGPEETARLVALLRDLAADHTIILIEHDMDAVFAAADTLTVLVQGRLLAHDVPEKIRRNEAVVEAYLGHRTRPEPSP